MQLHSEMFIKETEYQEKFRKQAESESLLNHLTTLRRSLWDIRAEIHELETALEDTGDLKAQVSRLLEQIEATAERLALEPLAVRET